MLSTYNTQSWIDRNPRARCSAAQNATTTTHMALSNGRSRPAAIEGRPMRRPEEGVARPTARPVRFLNDFHYRLLLLSLAPSPCKARLADFPNRKSGAQNAAGARGGRSQKVHSTRHDFILLRLLILSLCLVVVVVLVYYSKGRSGQGAFVPAFLRSFLCSFVRSFVAWRSLPSFPPFLSSRANNNGRCLSVYPSICTCTRVFVHRVVHAGKEGYSKSSPSDHSHAKRRRRDDKKDDRAMEENGEEMICEGLGVSWGDFCFF